MLLKTQRGRRCWFNNKRELHRIDGPAFESTNGTKEWWINGVQLTEEEFDTFKNR